MFTALKFKVLIKRVAHRVRVNVCKKGKSKNMIEYFSNSFCNSILRKASSYGIQSFKIFGIQFGHLNSIKSVLMKKKDVAKYPLKTKDEKKKTTTATATITS